MDNFGVPKKVNRHVLKALYYMQDIGMESYEHSEICHLVHISMRNNVPVEDLPSAVRQSLRNMAQLGVINTDGCDNYFVQNSRQSPVNVKRRNDIFKSTSDRRHEGSKLDPNLRKRHASEDSLKGDDRENSRKRFHTSKQLSWKGRSVFLPKAKMSEKFGIDVDQNEDDYEDDDADDEDDGNSDQSEVASKTQVTQMENDFTPNEVLKDQLVSKIFVGNVHESQSQAEPLIDEAEPSDDHEQCPVPMMWNTIPENKEVVTAEDTVKDNQEADPTAEVASEEGAEPTTEVARDW